MCVCVRAEMSIIYKLDAVADVVRKHFISYFISSNVTQKNWPICMYNTLENMHALIKRTLDYAWPNSYESNACLFCSVHFIHSHSIAWTLHWKWIIVIWIQLCPIGVEGVHPNGILLSVYWIVWQICIHNWHLFNPHLSLAYQQPIVEVSSSSSVKIVG